MPRRDSDWDDDEGDRPRKRSRRREEEDDDEEEERPRKRRRRQKPPPKSGFPVGIALLLGGGLVLGIAGVVVLLTLQNKGGAPVAGGNGVVNNPLVGMPPVAPPAVPRVPGPPPPAKQLTAAVTPPGYKEYACEYFSICTQGTDFDHIGAKIKDRVPPLFPQQMVWYCVRTTFVEVRICRVDAAFLADYQRDWAGSLDRLLETDLGVKQIKQNSTITWSDCTLSGIEGREMRFTSKGVPAAYVSCGYIRYVVKGNLLYQVTAPPSLVGGGRNPETDAVFDSFRVK